MNVYITNIIMYISMISVNLTSHFSIFYCFLFFNFCPLKCCFTLILSQTVFLFLLLIFKLLGLAESMPTVCRHMFR